MISLKVDNIKDFMNKLLIEDTFDNFCVSQFNIHTFVKFSIDGKINTKWYDTEEIENLEDIYVKWSKMKKYAYEIVKGNKVPSSFKIVLLLSKENTRNMVEKYNYEISENDVEGFFINIMYNNNELNIVTGISYKTFILDKTLDREWDNSVQLFFKKNDIEVITSTQS